MKKTYLTLITSLCSPFFVMPLEAHTGVYIGGQVGGGIGSVPVVTPFYDESATPPATAINRSRLGVRGPVGGVHFGAGINFLKFGYVGLEFSHDWANIRAKETRVYNLTGRVNYNPIKLSMNRTDSICAKLGAILKESFLLYLSFGAGYSKWKFESTIDTPYTKSKSLLGIIPGAGFSYAFTPHLLLGAEYKYAKYKELKAYQPSDSLNGPHKIKPSLHTLTLKVSWLI